MDLAINLSIVNNCKQYAVASYTEEGLSYVEWLKMVLVPEYNLHSKLLKSQLLMKI